MAGLEIGSICIKKTGREAGKKVVVIGIKDAVAIIDGVNVRRRNCNIRHLYPLGKKVELQKDASHEAVLKALQ